MSTRGWIEAALLCAGLAACAVASVYWGIGHGLPALRGIADPRLASAIWASLKIGAAAGLILGLITPLLGGAYLWDGARPPRLIIGLALAAALTPDLVHALVWRALLQPGLGPRALAEWLGAPAFQCATIGLVLAVKWMPLCVVVATQAAGRKRAALYRMLRLAQTPAAMALRRTYGAYAVRTALISGSAGALLGLRQHEASDILFGGGTGLRAEGLSQWTAKVALTFLDPGRASAQVLIVVLAALAIIGLTSRLVRPGRIT